MEKKEIKQLSNNAKEIKVIGQGCKNDCQHWKEVSGQNYYIAMIPCYQRICKGYYYYDSFWTSKF